MIKSKIFSKPIIASVIVIIVALLIVLSSGSDAQRKITGVVVDPLTNTPISGVDLVVGSTSIRTSGSGNFIFPSVDPNVGIKLTHPDILRAIVVLPTKKIGDEYSEIFFNTELLNTLITIVDMEARDNIEAIYELLIPETKEQLSKEKFRKEFEQFFVKENITDQEITIRGMSRDHNYFNEKFNERLKNVVAFEVILGKESRWYQFVWKSDLEVPTWALLF